MTNPALQLSGIASGYQSALVLRDLSLAIEPGGALALLGKNGMGKTTLLKTIMGYLPKVRGQMRLFGEEASRLKPEQMARAGIAYAAQERALFAEMSIRDNLRLALTDERDFDQRFTEICTLFPRFTERLKQKAGTLSGGEQKMLLLARALMQRPRLLLLDEISEGLQPSVIEQLAAALAFERKQRGTTILLVEQNVSFALSLCERWQILARGQWVADGSSTDAGAAQQILTFLTV